MGEGRFVPLHWCFSLFYMPISCTEDEEEEQPKLSSSNSCRLIPSLVKEACCTHCHVSFCLKSPSTFSSDDDEDEETIPDSDLDNKHVIILEIRSRKAKMKPKDYLFANSLHWVLSPTSGKLLIAPKEEIIDIEQEDDGGGKDDQSEVFHSVKSCFSRCSSEKELDYFSHLRARSVWDEFVHCEGWPFGLCKKALVLPPLPSSPSDSWTWRKRNQLGAKVSASTATSI